MFTQKAKLLLVLAVIVGVSFACAVSSGSGLDSTLPPEPTNTLQPIPSPPSLETAPPEGSDDNTSTPRAPLAGGEILFSDNFTNPESGWDRFSDELVSTDYVNGSYLIGVYAEKRVNWANPYLNFIDLIVKVEGQKITGGDDMQYGIVCRHADVDNWYVLVISADGFASIRKRFQGGDLVNLTDWVKVPEINLGNAVNNLQAECIGDRLSLFVNGALAVEAFDSDIPGGDVGLLAGTFSEPQTEVIFSNFVIHKP